jgi:hypothetical protein
MRSVAILGLALLLAACATGDAVIAGQLGPIDLATRSAPEDLRRSAEEGAGPAQLAWSLVLENGLRGVPQDPGAAAVWRAKATAQRGLTPTTLYTPAFRGHSSRVGLLMTPRYAVTPVEAVRVHACVQALTSPVWPEREKAHACGGSDNFIRLASAWRDAQTP